MSDINELEKLQRKLDWILNFDRKVLEQLESGQDG